MVYSIFEFISLVEIILRISFDLQYILELSYVEIILFIL